MESSWVYILACADGSYYTGCTTDLALRMSQHEIGHFPGYTSTRMPVHLVFSREFQSLEDAIRAERQIKGWSRKKKAALIEGNFELLHQLSRCMNETAALNGRDES
jgi:putative endonuclease